MIGSAVSMSKGMENSAVSKSSRPSASLLRRTPRYTNSRMQQLTTARARAFAQREVIVLQKLESMEKQSLNGVIDSNLFEQMTLNCATASDDVLEIALNSQKQAHLWYAIKQVPARIIYEDPFQRYLRQRLADQWHHLPLPLRPRQAMTLSKSVTIPNLRPTTTRYYFPGSISTENLGTSNTGSHSIGPATRPPVTRRPATGPPATEPPTKPPARSGTRVPLPSCKK